VSTDQQHSPPPRAPWSPRQHVAGFPLGILCIESHYPLVPGNMQHARTYSFAPLYGIVRGVTPDALFRGDPAILSPLLAAAGALVEQGVGAVVGACGSFAHFQRAAADALPVPVCLSILVQVPLLVGMLPAGGRLLVYFANRHAFTPALQAACGIGARELARLVVADAWDLPAFRAMLNRPAVLDAGALERQLLAHIGELHEQHPDLAGIVLQCSDLPPFAAAVQRATRLPVYDGTLLAEWMHAALVRRLYSV
jgi:hypothetical protein